MSEGLAWHYTLGQSVLETYRAGHIRAAPLAWFSTRPGVEPSCRRMIVMAGRARLLSLGELRRLGAGWFRLGLPVAEVLPAEVARERAGVSRDAWRLTVRRARTLGADLGQWFATLEAVDVASCRLQRRDAHPIRGQWQEIPDPRAWLSNRLDEEFAAAWRRLMTA